MNVSFGKPEKPCFGKISSFEHERLLNERFEEMKLPQLQRLDKILISGSNPILGYKRMYIRLDLNSIKYKVIKTDAYNSEGKKVKSGNRTITKTYFSFT